MDKVKLGISRCLLGENVRYDGGNTLDHYLAQTVSQFVEFVPLCPELELGLGVPREPIHLEGDPMSPRLVRKMTGTDLTEPMQTWVSRRVGELAQEGLAGFIFKAKSPSCGLRKVKVYDEAGASRRAGVGLYARAFVEAFPLYPVEEAERLQDPGTREGFLERIFVMRRFRMLAQKSRRSKARLVAFHSRHKLLIMSHSVVHYRKMGRLVAEGEGTSVAELYRSYAVLLIAALDRRATVRRHANVLHHILGYFKKQLGSQEKQELLGVIDRYRLGEIPLLLPMTLLNSLVGRFGEPYLAEQWYLNPDPAELLLRNQP